MSRRISEIAYMQRGLAVDHEYVDIVRDIIRSEQVQDMRKYQHYGYVDCLSHSLQVSYMAYRIAKKYGLNYKSLARASLLHDFYSCDWEKEGKGAKIHGFSSRQVALENAEHHFKMTSLEKDLIKRHMWPLNIGVPKYKESWVLFFADRYCNLMESLRIAPLQLRLFQ